MRTFFQLREELNVLVENIEDEHAHTSDQFERHIKKVKSKPHKKAFKKEFYSHSDEFSHSYENDDDDNMHDAHDNMKDVLDRVKAHNKQHNKKI